MGMLRHITPKIGNGESGLKSLYDPEVWSVQGGAVTLNIQKVTQCDDGGWDERQEGRALTPALHPGRGRSRRDRGHCPGRAAIRRVGDRRKYPAVPAAGEAEAPSQPAPHPVR